MILPVDACLDLHGRFRQAHADRGLLYLLRRKSNKAQQDFAEALAQDPSLKEDLERRTARVRAVNAGGGTKPLALDGLSLR